jgi:hypothetical protein
MNKPNKKGCIPTEDVCMEHEEPLVCKHGCSKALPHKCKELEEDNPKENTMPIIQKTTFIDTSKCGQVDYAEFTFNKNNKGKIEGFNELGEKVVEKEIDLNKRNNS